MRQQAEDASSELPPDEQLLLVEFSVASGTVSSSLASDPAFFSPTLTIFFTGVCCLGAARFWEWEHLGCGWWMGWCRSERVWSQLLTLPQPAACLMWCQGGLQHSANMGLPSGPVGWSGRNTLYSEIRDCKVGHPLEHLHHCHWEWDTDATQNCRTAELKVIT